MELGERKRSALVTAALITHHMFSDIRDNTYGGAMAAFDRIAEFTHEFEEKHKDLIWENCNVDYEEAVLNWTKDKLSGNEPVEIEETEETMEAVRGYRASSTSEFADWSTEINSIAAEHSPSQLRHTHHVAATVMDSHVAHAESMMSELMDSRPQDTSGDQPDECNVDPREPRNGDDSNSLAG